jgi:hypothetical protein
MVVDFTPATADRHCGRRGFAGADHGLNGGRSGEPSIADIVGTARQIQFALKLVF